MLKSDEVGQKAKVLFDYASLAPNQISLKAGEVITVVNYGGKGSWSKGKETATGKLGYFPSDYIELLPVEAKPAAVIPPPAAPVQQSSAVVKAKALFDFAGTGKNEMPLKRGEIFDVVLKGPAGGWSKGAKGAFPTDYVEFLPADPFQGLVAAPATSTAPVASSISAAFQPSMLGATAAGNRPISLSTTSSFATPAVGLVSGTSTTSGLTGPAGSSDLLSLDAIPTTRTSTSLLDDPFANLPLATPSSTSALSPAGITQPNVATVETKAAANSLPPFAATVAKAEHHAVVPEKPSRPQSVRVATEPAASTKVVDAPKSTASDPKTKATLVRVKYARVAGGPTELTIAVGDTLLVKDTTNQEWWYASTISGPAKAGYIPSNYVEVIQDSTSAAAPVASANISSNSSTTAKSIAVSSSTMVSVSGGVASGSSQHQNDLIDTSYDLSIKSNTPSMPRSVAEPTEELPQLCRRAGLTGSRYVFNKSANSMELVASWTMQPFLDLFTEPYTFSDPAVIHKQPAMERVRSALDCVISASKMVDSSNELRSEPQRIVFQKYMGALKDAQDVCRTLPPKSDDSVRFYTFLVSFMVRVRTLRVREYLLLPAFWVDEQDFEHCVLCLITKDKEETNNNYSLTLVNSRNIANSGLDYHPPSVDPTTGEIRRKLSVTFHNISDDRIQNSGFW
eukprot:scaffold246_cov181-Ochromonas_danica.AAC.9